MKIKISEINEIVSVGSVDGVCTTAALIRFIGNSSKIGLAFCEAFTVFTINPMAWERGRRVAFVDLAVNTRAPSMTKDFVVRVRESGHDIVAVIDEHSREAWGSALGSFDGLIIEPQTQKSAGAPHSSGELLRRALAGEAIDSHTTELLNAADAGDCMNFATHFGAIVNPAIKSSIKDNSRRVYLARHIAVSREPDKTILGWISEYGKILENNDWVIAGRQDLGDRIHRVKATGIAVDMTTLMRRLHGEGARVIVIEGEAHSKAAQRKIVQIMLVTNDRSLNLLSIVRPAVPSVSGNDQKVFLELKEEEAAIVAIRAVLEKRRSSREE